MRKLKMIIPAMVLAGCMMSMTASAAEKVTFNSVGIEMPAIECPEDMEGFFVPEEIGAIDAGHHVYAMDFVYGTKPEKEIIETLQDPELSDEERMQTKAKMVSVFGAILATDRGIEAAEKSYADDFGGDPMIFEEAQEIGTADGYTFYSVRGMTGAFENTLDLEHAKEFYAVRDAVDASIKEASFSVPVDPDKKMIGEKLEFTTTDLDGNTVTSADLFAGNKITMVNLWGTWCPNCMNEMGELAQLHERLQEKGCGIVGLDHERTLEGEEAMEAAKAALEEYGVTYPNAVMPEEFRGKVTGYPTTYFVNSDGVVLTMPIAGARVDRYEVTIDEFLDGKMEVAAQSVSSTEAADESAAAGESAVADESTATEADAAAAESASAYRVIVKDADGPVEGAMIQLCDDTTCNLQPTDASGVATFEVTEEKEYDVHVLVAPEGYEEDTTVYHTTPTFGDLNIELVKK